MSIRFVVSIFCIVMTILVVGAASAQDPSTELRTGYPSKAIRLVTSPAGGGGDLLARLIAQSISAPLGQQMIVDNRPVNLLGEAVAQAAPDGYTLLLLGNVLWLDPLMRKTPYDPIKDFAMVSMVGMTPNILVVHPSLPVKTVRELIALAKAHPRELNYAGTGAGSIAELAAELFKSMAGVDIVGIPFKGAGLALNSLIGGEVQLMFVTSASVMPHVKSGRLRALAVTSAEPSSLVPGLPTVAGSGLPGYDSVSLYGVFAPAKTPVAVIRRLNQEIVRVVSAADLKKKFLDAGVEAVGSSPEQLEAAIRSDMAKMAKVIKAPAP